MNNNYELKAWIEKHLPEGKQTFSRDAVEILLHLAWDEFKKEGRKEEARWNEADRYGDL